MSISHAQRIQGVATSIFSEMSALAAQHRAVNLGQGFPDFAGPDFIKAAAREAIDGNLNQYAPSSGLAVLQQAVGRSFERHYGRALDVTREVTVVSGATEGLLVSVLAFVNPGDEVILLEPWYDAYPFDVKMAGATPVYVKLKEPDWKLPIDDIVRAITPKTRAIMINTPLNPTGRVFSKAELQALADVVIKHDLLVISDEVYERLVFAPHRHVPIATLPGMWDRTITLNSTGKTFSMTGWKVGYVVAAPHLSDGVRRVHQFCTFATATPLQAAMATAIDAGETYERGFLEFYNARRDEMVSALRDAGFEVFPPEGTYFVMAGYRRFSRESDVEFCRHLTKDIGVAAIPPSVFFHDGHQTGLVRFCFAKKPETIAAAAERLRTLKPL